MRAWGVILAALVIFACGAVTGAMLSLSRRSAAESAATVSAQTDRGPNQLMPIQRADFLRRMEHRLDLTAQQKERIEKIMHESQERTHLCWDQIAPQMRDETRKVREAIEAELTADQRVKYQGLLNSPRGQGARMEAKPELRPEMKSPQDWRRRPRPDNTNRPDMPNRQTLSNRLNITNAPGSQPRSTP